MSVFPVRFLDEAIANYPYTHFHATVAETDLGILPRSTAQRVRNGG